MGCGASSLEPHPRSTTELNSLFLENPGTNNERLVSGCPNAVANPVKATAELGCPLGTMTPASPWSAGGPATSANTQCPTNPSANASCVNAEAAVVVAHNPTGKYEQFSASSEYSKSETCHNVPLSEPIPGRPPSHTDSYVERLATEALNEAINSYMNECKLIQLETASQQHQQQPPQQQSQQPQDQPQASRPQGVPPPSGQVQAVAENQGRPVYTPTLTETTYSTSDVNSARGSTHSPISSSTHSGMLQALQMNSLSPNSYQPQAPMQGEIGGKVSLNMTLNTQGNAAMQGNNTPRGYMSPADPSPRRPMHIRHGPNISLSNTLLGDDPAEYFTPLAKAKQRWEMIHDTLGSGHFATVRKCRDKITGEVRAIKIIERGDIAKTWPVVRDEIKVLRRVGKHPHIVELIDAFMDAKYFYLVMELCNGGDLFSRIVEGGRYSERDAARACRQLALALQYIHSKNVTHRDLKPENILLYDNTPESDLKVADFGLSKLAVGEAHQMRTVCGTWAYCAPEVIRHEIYTSKVDNWTLGVLMYILVAGYHPFDPFGTSSEPILLETITACRYDFEDEVWTQVSDSARYLISNLLRLDPNERMSLEDFLASDWIQGAAREDDISSRLRTRLSSYRSARLALNQSLSNQQGQQYQPPPHIDFGSPDSFAHGVAVREELGPTVNSTNSASTIALGSVAVDVDHLSSTNAHPADCEQGTIPQQHTSAYNAPTPGLQQPQQYPACSVNYAHEPTGDFKPHRNLEDINYAHALDVQRLAEQYRMGHGQEYQPPYHSLE